MFSTKNVPRKIFWGNTIREYYYVLQNAIFESMFSTRGKVKNEGKNTTHKIRKEHDTMNGNKYNPSTAPAGTTRRL
jgi:hypothetical protein